MTPVLGAPDYAFPRKALERWRHEYLTLGGAAGAADVHFKFEGSTCGNIAFGMIYRLWLDPGWTLRAAECVPETTAGDHRLMCGAMENATEFTSVLQTETPFLGLTLDDAIRWRPRTVPAGCLCTSAHRAHKWMIVLHTTHYALSQARATHHHENRTLS